MIVTLILLIMASAIVLFFSQEFINLFKWIFSFTGVPLVLPLALASLVVFVFPNEFLIVVYYVRLVISQILSVLISLLPLQQSAKPVALVVFLTLGAVVPVLLLQLLWQKKSYKGFQYPYWTSAFIWVVLALFLIVP